MATNAFPYDIDVKYKSGYHIDGSTLVSVEEGITEINNYAFYENKEINTIKCPSTLKRIGKGAISGCTNLTSISLNEGLEEIDDEAFL